jgi:hypothetical protein
MSKEHLIAMASKISVRARRLLAPAVVAYGDRWQSPLSRASGVAQSYLAMIACGDRPVTDDVEAKIVAALQAEALRMQKAAAQVAELVGKIVAARDD